MLHVGVRVEIGDALQVTGRAVLVCEVRSKVGDHATCRATFDLSTFGDARVDVGVATLISADVRVIAPAVLAAGGRDDVTATDSSRATASAIEAPKDHVVFAGRVQQLRESSAAGGVRRLTVTARSRSATLLGDVCAQHRYP